MLKITFNIASHNSFSYLCKGCMASIAMLMYNI